MTKQWHGGKGSTRRPVADQKQFADNWDKIFGKGDNNAKITKRRNEEKEEEPKGWKR